MARCCVIVLVLVVLVGLGVRSSFEGSLWLDELYTLALVHHAPAGIVDLCRVDASPPGYYLALKGWLKAARIVGMEPGVLWARALGIGAWLGLVFVTAWAGRRLVDRRASWLLTASIAGSAYAAHWASELRAYALAFPTLTLAWLLLLVLGTRPGKRDGLAWTVYVLLLVVASWSHLLAMPIVVLLAGLWILLAWRTRRPSFVACGALAHLVALIAFSPWLLALGDQLRWLQAGDTSWMTPSTGRWLVETFVFFLPLGGLGSISGPQNPWLYLLGLMAVGMPLGFVLAAAFRSRHAEGSVRLPIVPEPRASTPGEAEPSQHSSAPRSPESAGRWSAARCKPTEETTRSSPIDEIRIDLATFDTSAWLAASGLAISTVFVLLLFMLDRLDLASVFHAPRYPGLAAGIFAGGLVGGAIWATRRLGWLGRKRLAPWLVLLPWLVASFVGQAMTWRAEASRGLSAEARALLPPAGEPISVVPEDLAPFFRHTFADWPVRPIHAYALPMTVVSVNPWPVVDRPGDLILRRWLDDGLLATEHTAEPLPGWPELTVHRLTGSEGPAVKRLIVPGPEPLRPEAPGAVTSATPELQRFVDGWSYLEVRPGPRFGRWTAREHTHLRFDRGVTDGHYQLHLHGYHTERATLEIRIGDVVETLDLPPGDIQVEIPFTLDRDIGRISAHLVHPLAEAGERRLGFHLHQAWIVRLEV